MAMSKKDYVRAAEIARTYHAASKAAGAAVEAAFIALFMHSTRFDLERFREACKSNSRAKKYTPEQLAWAERKSSTAKK